MAHFGVFIAMNRAKKQLLLTEYYLDFYSQAVAILDDEDDAKDAVQEAVVKTLVHLGVQDPVKYCHRTTVNECFSILRRKRRLVRLGEVKELVAYDTDEVQQMVNESKEGLEPLERVVMEYHREEGYTVAQLSAIIGVSVSTVKRLLAVAENKMKKKLMNNL